MTMNRDNKSYLYLIFSASFILLSVTDAKADWYAVIGKSLSTTSTGPLMPSDMEECLVYKKESDEKYREINQAHQECLGNSAAIDTRIYSSAGTLINDKCSKAKCQELHDARNSFSNLQSENLKKCYADVAEYRRNHNKNEKVFNIKVDNDVARDAIQKYMRNKKGVTALTAIDMAELEKSCSKTNSTIERNDCIDAVHKYAADARKMSHSNSVISKIQEHSAEKINRIQKNTLNQGVSTLQSTKKSPSDCDDIGTEKSIDSIEINAEEDEMSKQINRCR